MSGNEHSISAADWRGICAQPLMFRHLENIARSECLYSPLSITRSLRRRNGGRIMSAYLIKILRCFGAIFISAEQLERCLSSFNHFFRASALLFLLEIFLLRIGPDVRESYRRHLLCFSVTDGDQSFQLCHVSPSKTEINLRTNLLSA